MARHCNGNPYCPNPPLRNGRCPTHLAEANTRLHPRARFYSSPEWRRLRTRILHLEPACRACGTQATDVDHVIGIEDGGAPLDPENLQPLCAPCHARKTRAEVEARRARG